MNFVAADLGASGTRYVSDSGKIQILPNNLVILNTGAVTKLEPNTEDIESNLEITIEKEGESTHFPVTFLAGKMAERYSPTFITPEIGLHKHLQRINYISAIMSVAVSKLTMGLSEDLLFVMDVPPVEIHNAREAFKKELVGSYTVTFHKYMGGVQVHFNIVDVAVFEESVMAMASFYFNMNGIPKEENKQFLRGKFLSLDIGASTSDAVVIENGKPLDYTGRTIKTGGNVARSAFINYITSQEGYDLPEEDAEVAIAEGRIAYGNGYKEVGNLVNMAKQELASQLAQRLKVYFSEIKTPLQQLRGVVVSGGGSMEGQYVNADGEIIKTSESLSKFVTDELQKLCEGVLVLPYGDDARFANIKGLFIRAKMILAKMGEAQQVQASQQVQQTQVVTPVAPQAVPVQQVVTPVAPVVSQQVVANNSAIQTAPTE